MHELKCSVFDAALKRLDYIFSEFDNIYISFSGGKDSGVLTNLVMYYISKNKLNIKPGIFHIDYEAQYSKTTEYVDQVYETLAERTEPLRCCVPVKEPVCTSMAQEYWRPWDAHMRDRWVREMPQNCLTEKDFDFFTEEMTDYEFMKKFAVWYHRKNGAGRTCALVGIRASESLNRWRVIGADRKNTYRGIRWTTGIADNIYNAYPIYDWKTEDIWTANHRHQWSYNGLYDLFYKTGLPLADMRVDSPFHQYAKGSLSLYRVIDPVMWEKLLQRVEGVNYTAIYGATPLAGCKQLSKPQHLDWKQYAKHLLKTLPAGMAEHFNQRLSGHKTSEVNFQTLCASILKKDYTTPFIKPAVANKHQLKKQEDLLERYRSI